MSIYHSVAITGAPTIERTKTPVHEDGRAQFDVGDIMSGVSFYLTVSDCVDLSERFGQLAADLLGEVAIRDLAEIQQRDTGLLDPPSGGVPAVEPAIRMDLDM